VRLGQKLHDGNGSDGDNMKHGVLRNILRKLRPRITKEPESEGQKVLIAEETIDNLLARELENQSGLEELLDSIIDERIQEIEALNESLRSEN
jgi:hypothetical protein